MHKEQITHATTGEQYTKIVLDSGLTVLCYPVEGYSIAHAVFATDFGSVDRKFTIDGKQYEIPAGTAHFLEHKMFENEDGKDAFELYAQTGASANAFTSFDKTCYIFTASDKIDESLDILLSFVSNPYFTKETVQKEQGIIAQEIKMYDDSAEWRMFFALLSGMYQNSFVKDDIAGTVESIGELTPELLYSCTDAFYNPSNMILSIAGNITEEQVLRACEKAGLYDSKINPVLVKILEDEPPDVAKRENVFAMEVAQPLLGLAFKETAILREERLKYEFIADILIELIIGETTELYRQLHDEGLINPGFEGDVLSGEGYFSIFFAGETENPDKVQEMLLNEIAKVKKQGVSAEDFEVCKNVLYGECITELESMSSVATNVATAHLKKFNYFNVIDTLASIKLDDVNETCKKWFDTEKMVKVVITPREV